MGLVMRVPFEFESGQRFCGFGCSQDQVLLGVVGLVVYTMKTSEFTIPQVS